jgi:hypothetical protein
MDACASRIRRNFALRLDAAVVFRRRCQSVLGAFDIELGIRFDPMVVKRGVIRHEIEHESNAARREPG